MMASELRHITLSDAEFTSSLHSFRRTHKDFLPNGEIVDWTAGDNQTVDVTMSIKGGSTVNQMVFTIESQQVIDILVRFCMENNVPVPRAGAKKWSSREAGITLSIALSGSELERANIDMVALA
eukprot:s1_g47.t1